MSQSCLWVMNPKQINDIFDEGVTVVLKNICHQVMWLMKVNILIESDVSFINEEEQWNLNINIEPEFVEFLGIPGIQYHVPNVDPFSYFNIFFYDDLYNNLVN